MGFKMLRGVRLSYNQQGRIYFTCKNYLRESGETQKYIERLCSEAGGEYAPALFELLTSENATVPAVAMRHFMSDATLSRCRKRFYTL